MLNLLTTSPWNQFNWTIAIKQSEINLQSINCSLFYQLSGRKNEFEESFCDFLLDQFGICASNFTGWFLEGSWTLERWGTAGRSSARSSSPARRSEWISLENFPNFEISPQPQAQQDEVQPDPQNAMNEMQAKFAAASQMFKNMDLNRQAFSAEFAKNLNNPQPAPQADQGRRDVLPNPPPFHRSYNPNPPPFYPGRRDQGSAMRDYNPNPPPFFPGHRDEANAMRDYSTHPPFAPIYPGRRINDQVGEKVSKSGRNF
jgi:hypothetical protein